MLGIIAAAVMAGSFFLPWLEFVGNELGPTFVFNENAPELVELPWRVWAFLGSFVLAAIAALLALGRRPAGVVMLLAGGIPYALIAEAVLGVRDRAQDLGLPIPQGRSPMETFDAVSQYMAIGLPAYFIAAALLVVIGLARLVRGA